MAKLVADPDRNPNYDPCIRVLEMRNSQMSENFKALSNRMVAGNVWEDQR